jgi:hypothetical protein
MWLHCVRQMWPQLCGPERHVSQIPTVSSVQDASVVNMSDRLSGGGGRQAAQIAGGMYGCGLCSILTRSWPRRLVGSCSLDGRRIVVLFLAGRSVVSMLRTSRPTREQTQSGCHSRGSSGRSVWLAAYLCSVSRFKNDGSLTSLTSTFRSVMVGSRVAVGRLV